MALFEWQPASSIAAAALQVSSLTHLPFEHLLHVYLKHDAIFEPTIFQNLLGWLYHHVVPDNQGYKDGDDAKTNL